MNNDATVARLEERLRRLEESARLNAARRVIPVVDKAELPTPQYQDMPFQGVSQNQPGFDWLHTHAMELT